MLGTAFELIPGDAGNTTSYHLPVKIAVVENADSTVIVMKMPLRRVSWYVNPNSAHPSINVPSNPPL